MLNFTPDFSKKSNFNSENAFTQVRFGFGSPLLEVELNEMQQIQDHFRKQILSNLYGFKNGLKRGDFFYDKEAQELQYSNLTMLITGDFFDLGSNIIKVTPNQSIVLSYGTHIVDGTSEVHKFGRIDSADVVPNKIIDERVMSETSRRSQAKFSFRMIDGEEVELAENELLFGYVTMDGEFRILMEQITIENAVTIEPQRQDAPLANFPVGASHFFLDNTPKYDSVGELTDVGDAEKYGYVFPNIATYPWINVVTEKFSGGYATQFAYLGSREIFFREANGTSFGEWIQIIDWITFNRFQEKINKQILDLTMEVAILSNANSSGVDSNIVVETFKNLDDINLIKGKYDAENRRIYLSY